MEYIEIDIATQIVTAHRTSRELPLNTKWKEYREAPGFDGYVYVTPVIQLGEDNRLITEEQAIELLQPTEKQFVKRVSGKWIIAYDHSNTEYFHTETQEQFFYQDHEPHPEDPLITTIRPHDWRAIWQDGAWVVPDEVFAREVREKRNFLLDHTDKYEIKGHPKPGNIEHILGYRQELRDITAQDSFPHDIEWPEIPEGVIIHGYYNVS